MPRRGETWTPDQRAKVAAAWRAKRDGGPDRRPTCDLCGIEAGSVEGRGVARVRVFGLVAVAHVLNEYGVDVVDLRPAGALRACERCWRTTLRQSA